jgi:hypothetical protein
VRAACPVELKGCAGRGRAGNTPSGVAAAPNRSVGPETTTLVVSARPRPNPSGLQPGAALAPAAATCKARVAGLPWCSRATLGRDM